MPIGGARGNLPGRGYRRPQHRHSAWHRLSNRCTIFPHRSSSMTDLRDA